ncbi:aspartyl/glutamyl-tRNA(Asn/Gln) amidotransferase subunit A [Candidatus Profftella armatura (Diaphorina cf. continua)]|uniref:Glutamyl-tRNA(Gln) amidotransferase subunit A n=1 Tax=Candidatus Profftella armatura (Diaphorina cf. continua) TaxID=2661583 RepID=A0A7R6VZR4_9PROT|nr:Asp-tRNA(Asn)/Glu-tRNA(Gln) amidotransferase subunit GatA [Candidatus Profftella armatura (Diaphorina cf. continua)]BCG49631.1 aspartyl/glutamyl-tRNA(Asn/Gln) amidotransferase subunit A [Candidatus Profftella armatura (Diaphorina cf. continua)]
MYNKTIKELSLLLNNKKISVIELTKIFLDRIKTSNLNAFLHVDEELTLIQANIAEKKLISGNKTQLTGIPIAHKDIFVTRHWKTTAGSKMLANYISPFNADIVERLKKAGTVMLGKLNCDEFAMGSSNENSYFGPVRNPWDYFSVPGGSSGGSAAAVAARLAPATTASDTGGSIRQPASLCGVTGIKPTYGSISRYGMIAFASSLDQAGPIAKTAEDCALLLNVMIGFDKRDSTSLQRKDEDFSYKLRKNTKGIKGLRIGMPREFFNVDLESDVQYGICSALKEFEKLGAKLVDISMPKTNLSIPVYYVIAPAEAASNLSRFDGVRYGYRSKNYKNLIDMYKKSRTEGFGEEVKRRILIGSHVLSHDCYNTYYLQAQRIRRLISEDFQKILTGPNSCCDVIMGPVSPTVAWNIGDKRDPVINYLSDIFTLSTSLAGLPGMSIPCGFSKNPKNINRPIGLQIIGNYFKEAQLLYIAHQYQNITDWHLKTPKL